MYKPERAAAPAWHLFVPKTFTVLREGYGFARFKADAVAGMTVAIVALPLAMALGIASGSTPDRGLFTAVVAGFLISFLGGSRYQIGGPTGAFVVVVFNIIEKHGYEGLVIATLMAGLILVAVGLMRLGTIIKYIPYPVITGFTSGIALIIFSSQVKDLLGLSIDRVPADFLSKWTTYFAAIGTTQAPTAILAALSLAGILVLRRYRPALPGFLVVVVLAAIAAWAFGLPVETIGSRFGGIPSSLPTPSLPSIDLQRVRELLPSAITIAFLAGIESLLSAVIADGMTGARHRSNCELVAQGIANFASACFGGIPATGALARTATNIKAGARSPVAGMLHAAFLLAFMWLLAPAMSWVPLGALAAVLVVVAWNMSEIERFRHLLRAPGGDQAILLITFFLTVLVDITVAVMVGIGLAGLLFMRRMVESTEVTALHDVFEEDADDLTRPRDPEAPQYLDIPAGVQVFQINGPFFFGAASRLGDLLDQIGRVPRVFVLRFRQVPFIDATGAHALGEFVRKCRSQGTAVVLCQLSPQVRATLGRMGTLEDIGEENIAGGLEQALTIAEKLNGSSNHAGPGTSAHLAAS